jgi:hypothetical protein
MAFQKFSDLFHIAKRFNLSFNSSIGKRILNSPTLKKTSSWDVPRNNIVRRMSLKQGRWLTPVRTDIIEASA